ncbi:MAG: RNA 2',3'-cyclic phosphodiesterase [Thermomicrobiales bacterium]
MSNRRPDIPPSRPSRRPATPKARPDRADPTAAAKPEPDTPSSDAPPPRKKRLRRPRTPEPPRRVEETVDTAQRLFIALPLPREVIALVDRTVDTLKREPWPVKWSDPENAHITLHFLGDVDPAAAEVLRLALAAPVAASEAFDLRTADLGAFPTIRKPRVLWLGLWGPVHRLETLHGAIGATLESLGFALEERAFSPHITLGRVRSDPRDARQRDLPQQIRARLDALAASGAVTSKHPVPLPVTEVQLIRSHLNPQGARYEVLATYPLRRPAGKD